MGEQRNAKGRRRLERMLERQRIDRLVEEWRARTEALFDEFEDLLRHCGAVVRNGSKLEQALLLARHIKYVREEDAPLPELAPDDEDDMFRRAAWIWGVAPKLIAAARHESFPALIPHVRLVVDGEFAQSVPGERNEDSDKLFELVTALAVLPVVRNLRMDNGDGTPNPDLLFDFHNTRWAIACKALYSTRPERYRESVIKGASQIERSEAERGIVCVSLRNLLDHRLFMPRRGAALVGMSKESMNEVLDGEEGRIRREIIDPVVADVARDLVTRAKTENGVAHIVAGCGRTGTPEHVNMTYFARVMTVGDLDDQLVEALNAGLQAAPS